jgi:hypothetical protein
MYESMAKNRYEQVILWYIQYYTYVYKHICTLA